MLGATTIWDGLGARTPGMKRNLGSLVRDLAKGGVPLVPLDDLGHPLDMRSSVARKQADKAAVEAATAAGAEGAARARSRAGAALATSDPAAAVRALDAYATERWDQAAWEADGTVPYPNIGLTLSGERLVVVECARMALTAFTDWFGACTGGCPINPTMSSETTSWFFFPLPEGVSTPAGVPELLWGAGDATVRVLLRDRVIPVPPSVIAGDPIIWHGGIFDAPAALLGAIAEAGEAATELGITEPPAWVIDP